MTTSPIPIGEVFANKYRIDGVLGEGGMGIVMAAHHLELDQRVAIKFLLDDLSASEEGAERFRREARAAARIQSDHVVRVLDVGVLDSGERYMVMEFLDGHDLAEEISRVGRVPVGEAASYLIEAIDAVGHAHTVGIIHRDLKPANLFLSERRDGSRRIKVLDFGISKFVGAASAPELSLTRTSAWIGSPLYMSPEQMEAARDVDERADIWSLGAILYELIAGRTPYIADTLPHLCNQLITSDPEPIAHLCPELPQGLADAVMACLVRDPKERTQSVEELAEALEPYATNLGGRGARSSFLGRTDVASSRVLAEVAHSGQARSRDAASVEIDLSNLTTRDPEPESRAVASPDALPQAKTTVRSAEVVTGGTRAAWGGTDPGPAPKKSSSRLALLAVSLVGALAVGFLLARRAAEAEPSDATAAASEAEVPLNPVGAEPPGEKSVAKPEDKVDPVFAGEESQKRAKKEASAPEMQVSPTLPTPVVVSSPSPKPRVKARPRPSSRPPAPEPKDDFADFGGRR